MVCFNFCALRTGHRAFERVGGRLRPTPRVVWLEEQKEKRPETSRKPNLKRFLLFRYDGAALFTAFCGAIGTAGRKVAAVMPPVMAERQLWWLIAALYSSMEQLRVTNQDYSKLKKVLPPDMWAELELRANKFVWAMFRYTTEVVETGEVPNKLSNYAAYEVFRQVGGSERTTFRH